MCCNYNKLLSRVYAGIYNYIANKGLPHSIYHENLILQVVAFLFVFRMLMLRLSGADNQYCILAYESSKFGNLISVCTEETLFANLICVVVFMTAPNYCDLNFVLFVLNFHKTKLIYG